MMDQFSTNSRGSRAESKANMRTRESGRLCFLSDAGYGPKHVQLDDEHLNLLRLFDAIS